MNPTLIGLCLIVVLILVALYLKGDVTAMLKVTEWLTFTLEAKAKEPDKGRRAKRVTRDGRRAELPPPPRNGPTLER